MTKTAKKAKQPKATKALANVPRRRLNVTQNPMSAQEAALLQLVADPCHAPLVNGYGLSTTGIVQRFVDFKYLTPGNTDAVVLLFNPADLRAGNFGGVAVSQGAYSAPVNFVRSSAPGSAFVIANADSVSTLAACISVAYVGPLMERKGFVGVCQAPWHVLNDIMYSTTVTPTELLKYCQSVGPVPSHSVEVKWSPGSGNYTGANQVSTAQEATGAISDNGLMVVLTGVDPAQFMFRIVNALEYAPKFTMGQPAARVTKQIPPGVGSRIISTLDRAGHWWHNLGDAAASAARLGSSVLYGAGNAIRLARGGAAIASHLLKPAAATALLALTG